MNISNIAGVVLAGGTNSRFGGRIKANEIIGGERIIVSILKTLRPLFNEIIIVTNTPEEFSDTNECIITGDHFKGRGPLGGIHAAMKASSKDAIFVFAGDMPFLNGDLIISQALDFCSDPADALIPKTMGNIEPLHSVYRTNILDKLEDFLTKGSDNMIRSFLNILSVRYFLVPDKEFYTRSFTNVNTTLDLQKVNLEILTPSPAGDVPIAIGRVGGFSSQGSSGPLNNILKRHSPLQEHLIAILHNIQNNTPEQFISEDDMKSVAEYLNIPLSSVYGVVTYYSMFSHKPRGKFIIRVCSSPVCEMTGSAGLLKGLERKLGIGRDSTTTDRLFTLETCECLGHCEEAPGMIVNERFYGNLNIAEANKIIDNLKAGGE